MKRKWSIACVVIAGTLLLSTSATAKSRFERLEAGLYFGVHQTARGFQGGVLSDNVRRNTKQLWQAAHEHCLQEGFSYMHSITVVEIARDEELRAIWEVVAGGGGRETSETTALANGAGRANTIRRLLRFVAEPGEAEGWEKCVAKPQGATPEAF